MTTRGVRGVAVCWLPCLLGEGLVVPAGFRATPTGCLSTRSAPTCVCKLLVPQDGFGPLDIVPCCDLGGPTGRSQVDDEGGQLEVWFAHVPMWAPRESVMLLRRIAQAHAALTPQRKLVWRIAGELPTHCRLRGNARLFQPYARMPAWTACIGQPQHRMRGATLGDMVKAMVARRSSHRATILS